MSKSPVRRAWAVSTVCFVASLGGISGALIRFATYQPPTPHPHPSLRTPSPTSISPPAPEPAQPDPERRTPLRHAMQY